MARGPPCEWLRAPLPKEGENHAMSSASVPTSLSLLAAVVLTGAVAGPAIAADGQNHPNIANPNHCKIVERKPGEANNSSSLSSSVTAGNGHVTAETSGGNSVTVHSGNGSVSSSVATTGSGNGNTVTTVTTSNGGCIIYVTPQKKEP